MLVSRAIKRTAGDSNVRNGQGVRWLDSGKLGPLYGAADFRAVRSRFCTTSSVLVAKGCSTAAPGSAGVRIFRFLLAVTVNGQRGRLQTESASRTIASSLARRSRRALATAAKSLDRSVRSEHQCCRCPNVVGKNGVDMQRRAFVTVVGFAVWWASVGRAQSPSKVPRLGFLSPTSKHSYIAAFMDGLRDLGYIEGKTIVIDFRSAEEQYERLPALAAELVRLNPDVLATYSNPAVVAMKAATDTIPIVIVLSGDAVDSGLVESLSRPGRNVTGQTFFNPELNAKRLELLKEAVPRVQRIGVICNPDNAVTRRVLQAMMRTANSLGLELQIFEVRRSSDFASTLAAMKARGADAVVMVEDVITLDNTRVVADFVIAEGLPAIGFLGLAEAGGLMSYGVDFPYLFRHGATFVDRVIRGVKPSELPMEQPSKFRFIVNLKSAKALALTLPSLLLMFADEIIE